MSGSVGDSYLGFKISNNEKPNPGSYRGRISSEPENIRKTLLDNKNA